MSKKPRTNQDIIRDYILKYSLIDVDLAKIEKRLTAKAKAAEHTANGKTAAFLISLIRMRVPVVFYWSAPKLQDFADMYLSLEKAKRSNYTGTIKVKMP